LIHLKVVWSADKHTMALANCRSAGFCGGKGILPTSKPNLVFVVDDDPNMLKAIGRLLRVYGYKSHLFPSVEAFEEHDDFQQATCIILDINLNGASGLELRRRLKDAGISVPIIYITGNDKPEVHAAALKSGCIAYLTKPFSGQSLIEPIEKASA